MPYQKRKDQTSQVSKATRLIRMVTLSMKMAIPLPSWSRASLKPAEARRLTKRAKLWTKMAMSLAKSN